MASTVNLQQSRQLLAILWEAEERRHASRFALEGADVEGDVAINDAVLFTFSKDAWIKRISAGIKIGEEFLDRCGPFSLGRKAGDGKQEDKAK